VEVLACPHCDRLFQVALAALGKKIRCRGCRGIFHVPHDTTRVPLGPLPADPGLDEPLPPLAIPCVIDGHDARSCPECGRTFRMKTTFAGKTIRCRGCKATFRVSATAATIPETTQPDAKPVQTTHTAGPAPLRPQRMPPPPTPAARPPSPPPTISEDMGDLLEDIQPGEHVPSVVRPRTVSTLSTPQSNPVATLAAVVAGGICALPATLIILRFVSKKRFEDVASVLPEFFVDWLR
jgi:hypothetical protein